MFKRFKFTKTGTRNILFAGIFCELSEINVELSFGEIVISLPRKVSLLFKLFSQIINFSRELLSYSRDHG